MHRYKCNLETALLVKVSTFTGLTFYTFLGLYRHVAKSAMTMIQQAPDTPSYFTVEQLNDLFRQLAFNQPTLTLQVFHSCNFWWLVWCIHTARHQDRQKWLAKKCVDVFILHKDGQRHRFPLGFVPILLVSSWCREV